MNSDKEVKIKDYQDKLHYYNANKTKFLTILTGKPVEKWEEEANKIIKGNIYLGLKWKLDKVEYKLKRDEEKLKSNELSNEEEKELQKDIVKNKKELSEGKQDLEKKIRTDIAVLQQL